MNSLKFSYIRRAVALILVLILCSSITGCQKTKPSEIIPEDSITKQIKTIEVTEGNTLTVSLGSGLTFTVEDAFEDFEGLIVEDKEADKSDYYVSQTSVSEGGFIAVHIKGQLFSKLGTGEYKVAVKTAEGETDIIYVTVTEKANEEIMEGDNETSESSDSVSETNETKKKSSTGNSGNSGTSVSTTTKTESTTSAVQLNPNGQPYQYNWNGYGYDIVDHQYYFKDKNGAEAYLKNSGYSGRIDESRKGQCVITWNNGITEADIQRLCKEGEEYACSLKALTTRREDGTWERDGEIKVNNELSKDFGNWGTGDSWNCYIPHTEPNDHDTAYAIIKEKLYDSIRSKVDTRRIKEGVHIIYEDANISGFLRGQYDVPTWHIIIIGI